MKGFVYVMMTPSYQGVIKIGKTTKDPEERAKELSSAMADADSENPVESAKLMVEYLEFEKEKLQLVSVYSFVREFISEVQSQSNTTVMMYRLED